MKNQLWAVSIVCFLAGCGGEASSPTTPSTPPVKIPTSITLSPISQTFTSLGVSSQITATVRDQNSVIMTGQTQGWATSDAMVATVTSGGWVTPVASGTATISAASGTLVGWTTSATATISVEDFLLGSNGVTVTCASASVGQTGTINGLTYTKRSKSQIETLISGQDYVLLETTCTSGITDMRDMFVGATSFNQDIGSWDVSSVTVMQYMFRATHSFNQDIGSWDVSSVKDMVGMFYDATSFNQDLSGWCVSNIGSSPIGFDSGATAWTNAAHRPVWGTCP